MAMKKTRRLGLLREEIKLLEIIAKQYLDVDTLESRGSDALDFYDLGVGRLRAALEAAYWAGVASKRR
jgi:hypothetical protein